MINGMEHFFSYIHGELIDEYSVMPRFRVACSHGGGGPRVGEVPHIPVVKKTCLHMQPGEVGVRFKMLSRGQDKHRRISVYIAERLLEFCRLSSLEIWSDDSSSDLTRKILFALRRC